MYSSPSVQRLPTHQGGNEQMTFQAERLKSIDDRSDLPASKKIERGPTLTQKVYFVDPPPAPGRMSGRGPTMNQDDHSDDPHPAPGRKTGRGPTMMQVAGHALAKGRWKALMALLLKSKRVPTHNAAQGVQLCPARRMMAERKDHPRHRTAVLRHKPPILNDGVVPSSEAMRHQEKMVEAHQTFPPESRLTSACVRATSIDPVRLKAPSVSYRAALSLPNCVISGVLVSIVRIPPGA